MVQFSTPILGSNVYKVIDPIVKEYEEEELQFLAQFKEIKKCVLYINQENYEK